MENTEYLKQKKKKKKSRKYLWLILLLLLVAAAGLFVYQKKKAEAEAIDPNARENVVLGEKQGWLYLEIESIIGNEITAVETTAPRRMEMPQRGEKAAQSGQAQGEQPSQHGEKAAQSGQLQRESAATADGELTGEAKAYMIPVGTDVVTKLGSETTFSRLAAGDTICCLVEESGGEPVILKIWIEE